MTLIEVLVAMALFAVLGTILLGLALSTRDVAEVVRDRNGTTEEARTAMERITRELRQARAITAVTLGTDDDPECSITFWTDYDQDGIVDTGVNDLEKVTYSWTPPTASVPGKLLLSAAGRPGAPLLAANVTEFEIGLQSSAYDFDRKNPATGESDGVTTWKELDQAVPPGNNNGAPDLDELPLLDLVTLSMKVEDGQGTQTYRTQVDLRNAS